jgi:hypothetical protein
LPVNHYLFTGDSVMASYKAVQLRCLLWELASEELVLDMRRHVLELSTRGKATAYLGRATKSLKLSS